MGRVDGGRWFKVGLVILIALFVIEFFIPSRILVSFRFLDVFDFDGLSLYGELTRFKTSPFKGDMLVAYGFRRGLDYRVARVLKILEDGRITSNDRKLIDFLKFMNNEFIPENLRKYYPATFWYIKKEEGEFVRYTITRVDPLDWQVNLIKSIGEDGKVSDREIYVLNELYKFSKSRWNIVRDIINSGMISDNYLDEDWDEDGITNIEEVEIGINPLNDLEVNPSNLSEIYFIILTNDGGYHTASNGIGLYHMCKMNGIDDDHILFFWDLIGPQIEKFENIDERYFNLSGWERGMAKWLEDRGHPLRDFYVEIDYRQGPNRHDFFRIVKDEIGSRIDENDILVIYYRGEGPTPALWKVTVEGEVLMRDHILPSEMNLLLTSLNYGRCILINDCCGPERLFIYDTYYERDGMYAPNPLHDFIGIATCKADEGAALSFYHFFAKLMDKVSIKEAFDYAYQEITERISDQHPVLYCFDEDNDVCEWMNYTNPFTYIPKKGKPINNQTNQ